MSLGSLVQVDLMWFPCLTESGGKTHKTSHSTSKVLIISFTTLQPIRLLYHRHITFLLTNSLLTDTHKTSSIYKIVSLKASLLPLDIQWPFINPSTHYVLAVCVKAIGCTHDLKWQEVQNEFPNSHFSHVTKIHTREIAIFARFTFLRYDRSWTPLCLQIFGSKEFFISQ